MSQATISELTIFPVKSLQGISLQQAEVTEFGLKWDRFWMVVNEDGQFATQRQLGQMAKITTAITETELILSYPNRPSLHVSLELPEAKSRLGKVWSSECDVWDEGDEARNWLTEVIGLWRGQKLSLVRMAPDFNRQVSQKHTNGAINYTYFADGYPYLVCNTASLLALNKRLAEQELDAVPMSRFRANIVLQSSDAFAEHQHSTLTLSQSKQGVELNLCKPCQRCKVIGIDQASGEELVPQQPLKTLMSMSHVEQKGAYFGHNAVVSEATKSQLPLVIKVGDSVTFNS